MSDLRLYIDSRKKTDPEFSENFDKGYQDFKLGAMLRQSPEKAGLTQKLRATTTWRKAT